jgi:microcystin-dependent protein
LQAALSPSSASPAGASLSPTSDGASVYRAASNLKAMASASVSTAGSGSSHNNRQPYLGVSFIIALQGIYPPRS